MSNFQISFHSLGHQMETRWCLFYRLTWICLEEYMYTSPHGLLPHLLDMYHQRLHQHWIENKFLIKILSMLKLLDTRPLQEIKRRQIQCLWILLIYRVYQKFKMISLANKDVIHIWFENTLNLNLICYWHYLLYMRTSGFQSFEGGILISSMFPYSDLFHFILMSFHS